MVNILLTLQLANERRYKIQCTIFNVVVIEFVVAFQN